MGHVCLVLLESFLLAHHVREHSWQRLISFWIVNSQSVGFTVSLVTISSNMGGYTKRSVASAIIFSGYCKRLPDVVLRPRKQAHPPLWQAGATLRDRSSSSQAKLPATKGHPKALLLAMPSKW